jgi:YggT family protein
MALRPERAAMLLDAAHSIATFISVFAGVYVIVLIAYILTSWIKLPYSLQPVQRFLYDVCEPYLRFWRRLLPFAVGPIDFTPMVAIIALLVVAGVVETFLNRL